MLKINCTIFLSFSLFSILSAQDHLTHTIHIYSEPSYASVIINGKDAGKTPLKYDFEIFKDYLIKVKMDGYYSDFVTINGYFENDRINFVLFPRGEKRHEFVKIDEADFIMGGGDKEDNNYRHKVHIKPFYITKYEITNRQYCLFLNEINCDRNGNYKGAKLINMSAPNSEIEFLDGRFMVNQKYGKHPAVNVTWYGAAEYCKWAGGRLPTEAEWEYAAKGNSNKFIYSGSNSADEVAWYTGNSMDRIHNIGEKEPNEFGLFDMSGNAMEWVNDFYSKYYYKNSRYLNPLGPKKTKYKIARGGAWNRGMSLLQLTYRFPLAPDYSNENLGFRCVFDVKK